MSSELRVGLCVLELVYVCFLGLSVTMCVFFVVCVCVCLSVCFCVYVFTIWVLQK